MKKSIMYLFARTPVHVGAGNSVGAVDSPVMRERHTRIPIIPGSALKGVLSDLWNEVEDGKIVRSAEGKALFGEDDMNQNAQAGTLLIGEARVLAFPVRSAKGMFAWITCPLVLNRYARDVGAELGLDDSLLDEMGCLASPDVAFDAKKVVLEEYVFDCKGDTGKLADLLKVIMPDNKLWQSVDKHLVVLSDSLFSHFVEHACEVVTRIRVDDETGTVAKGALFNQEQVPSETMFYCSVVEEKRNREIEPLQLLKEKVSGQILQVGGDETIGLGFCDVEVK